MTGCLCLTLRWHAQDGGQGHAVRALSAWSQIPAPIGGSVSAACAAPISPKAVNETPARKSFFIVLPQAVVAGAFEALLQLTVTSLVIFREGQKKNRCGLPRAFVK